MIRLSSILAALAVVALPTFGLATAATARPHHGGHGHPGGHHGGHHGGHGGGHHGGRPHGPRHGFGPHHARFGHPGHGFGPRIVLREGGPRFVVRGGRRVVLRPFPVFVGGPAHRAPLLRYAGPGVPLVGGCSTRRSVSLTPYGWHRIVTVQTCLRP